MSDKYYVYILRAVGDPERTYVGLTTDINRRVAEHNSGSQVHTKRYVPWELLTYVVFSQKRKATDFEKYLKSSSGRAFMKKRLL